MNAEFVNPLEIKRPWSLAALFKDAHESLYVWLNYDTGEVSFTRWDTVPEELYDVRPVARAYTHNYALPNGLPCSRTLIYGPAAGGLGEAGAFKLQTCGERIDALVPFLGFKNRELGAHIINKKVGEALLFIERFAGQFSISYASLFAVLAFSPNEKCMQYIHTALELERVHNHIWVMHKLAGDASQKVATAHLAAMTEELLRINLRLLGHRYGMGFLRHGPREYEEFYGKIRTLHEEFTGLSEELLNSRIFIDRLHTTCKLDADAVLLNDTGGIPARAAGVARDARKYGVLKALYSNFVPHTEQDGDALARLMVRINEVEDSLAMLESAEWGACKFKPANAFRYGFIETPPGDAFMAVRVEDGRVREFMLRPASLPLYHAFSVGIKGNVFTDFPFALDSFGIYFADADSHGRWL
ncbi:MAG: NADH-quinone oxidoreductase subunit F [Euryarchaeota archaeon]|nr:NADH-quinone oxidoreductase subunit F [Euryarchaeota archaeon]